jgi:HlyD family secretion protein
VDRQYDIGQTVAASFSAPTLFTIAQDMTKMQVQADVDQSDIGNIKVGQPVRFTVDAYPDEQFRAEISQVRLNATVNQNVITYPVIISVANPDLTLRPSMTADVTIQVNTVKDVLRVPNAALRFRPPVDEDEAGQARGQSQGGARQGGDAGAASGGRRGRGGRQAGQSVYVLAKSENGKESELREVKVKTGITDGRNTEVVKVLSGTLNPGDPVVTGLATLKVEQQAGSPLTGGGRRGMGRF